MLENAKRHKQAQNKNLEEKENDAFEIIFLTPVVMDSLTS